MYLQITTALHVHDIAVIEIKLNFSLYSITLKIILYRHKFHLICHASLKVMCLLINFRDKLTWAFKMYDIDGNGTIDQEEMQRQVKMSSSLLELFLFLNS